MTTHDELSKDDWHHGYSAGALLRLVALALRECVDDQALMDWQLEQNNCFHMLADAIERRASTLHESAYGVVSELCSGLLTTLRTLYGGGGIHARADYLLCRLAAKQPDWLDTMKRRKHWLALVQDDEEVQCQCGEALGEACAWTGPKSDTVVVEWMPEHLRSSHAAAGNRGVYPANGALRLRMEWSCAERLLEDEWASEVEDDSYECEVEGGT